LYEAGGNTAFLANVFNNFKLKIFNLAKKVSNLQFLNYIYVDRDFQEGRIMESRPGVIAIILAVASAPAHYVK
jgi:hypothetical protein